VGMKIRQFEHSHCVHSEPLNFTFLPCQSRIALYRPSIIIVFFNSENSLLRRREGKSTQLVHTQHTKTEDVFDDSIEAREVRGVHMNKLYPNNVIHE